MALKFAVKISQPGLSLKLAQPADARNKVLFDVPISCWPELSWLLELLEPWTCRAWWSQGVFFFFDAFPDEVTLMMAFFAFKIAESVLAVMPRSAATVVLSFVQLRKNQTTLFCFFWRCSIIFVVFCRNTSKCISVLKCVYIMKCLLKSGIALNLLRYFQFIKAFRRIGTCGGDSNLFVISGNS